MRDKRFLPFMLVTIKGSKKEYRDLVRRAVWFYAEKLMGKRLVNTLELTINLTRNLTEKEGAEGFQETIAQICEAVPEDQRCFVSK